MRARPHVVATVATLLGAALAALAGACSLTTSLSGLSNGPADPDAAATDAATGADGTASVPESGAAGDASGGGGDGSVPATPFRCADHSGVLFCADFEDGPLDTGWSHTRVDNGGTLALGNGRFGRGLVATVPTRGSTSASTRPSAALETGVNLAARAPITLGFDMKIENGSAGGGVLDLSGIDFHGPFYIVTLRADDDGSIHVHEYGDPIAPAPAVVNDFPMTRQPAIGNWLHVALQMTFPTGGPARLVVLFDGATAFDGAIGAAPYAAQPFVYAGIDNAEDSGQARTIDFDDVLVTTP